MIKKTAIYVTFFSYLNEAPVLDLSVSNWRIVSMQFPTQPPSSMPYYSQITISVTAVFKPLQQLPSGIFSNMNSLPAPTQLYIFRDTLSQLYHKSYSVSSNKHPSFSPVFFPIRILTKSLTTYSYPGSLWQVPFQLNFLHFDFDDQCR